MSENEKAMWKNIISMVDDELGFSDEQDCSDELLHEDDYPEVLPCDGDAYASCEPGGCPRFYTCRYGADRYYKE